LRNDNPGIETAEEHGRIPKSIVLILLLDRQVESPELRPRKSLFYILGTIVLSQERITICQKKKSLYVNTNLPWRLTWWQR
jgi:hypothetical protein